MISPMDFIPFAEETGLITHWILRRACMDGCRLVQRSVCSRQPISSTVKNVFRADLGEAWRQEGASQDQQQGAQ